MGRLDEKVAIITGAAGGIGRVAAERFVQEGCRVLLVDLDEQLLRETCDQIGESVSYVAADVSQVDDSERYFQLAVERYGRVDILLANAGIEGQIAMIEDYDVEEFDRVMAVNVRGVWLGVKYAFVQMKKQGGGCILITSSTSGVTGSPKMSAYNASKHAVIGIMRSAARDGAPHGIRVNTVNPCPTETRMMRSIEQGIDQTDPTGVYERIKHQIPLGRYADPREIANVMLFLSSDEASYLTGSVYMADAGITC